MKPFINLDEVDNYIEMDNEPYVSKRAPISEKIGAKKLGYSIAIVPPGNKVCPFHNHHINEEMFMILEGSGILRFGDKEYPIRKHDIIACPPGGRELAHQIVNTSDQDIKYLCLSTNEPVEICEYPDSDKVLSMVGTLKDKKIRHIARIQDAVDYFEGEERQ